MPSLPTKNKRLQFMGIDPGKSGGISIITENREVLFSRKMPPTETALWNLFSVVALQKTYSTKACLEKVHSMPKQGVTAMFTFGDGFGQLKMALIAAGISHEIIPPQKWQRALSVPPKKKSQSKRLHKKKMMAMAQSLFPQESVTLATADSLLLAEYCRRCFVGEIRA